MGGTNLFKLFFILYYTYILLILVNVIVIYACNFNTMRTSYSVKNHYFIVSLICVAILWGGTNPWIKRNSKDIDKVRGKTRLSQFLLEIKYLATNIQYLMPMALNQLGSVLYYVTLQKVDLSLSVPVANSLTFVFTAISGWILGEQIPKAGTLMGIVLILIGTTLCCYDKHLNAQSIIMTEGNI